MYLLACVVDYFNCYENFEIESTGVKNGDLFISYKSIYNDVRKTVDFVHHSGLLQRECIEKKEKYIARDARLPMMLQRLRQHAKVFILTNSGYWYTNAVMKYLLEDETKPNSPKWTEFFDVIVVDACKPLFFEEGTLLRQVDLATGTLAIGRHTGPIRSGQIYSGGNCDVLSELIGAKGRDVLYVGDHIFGDILRSKKRRGWRTYLVVPELHQELLVWTSKRELFEKIQQLDILLADAYKFLDSGTMERNEALDNEVCLIKKAHRQVRREMDMAYGGPSGSVFRSGGRQTFFANQVQRYADLYAVSSYNLLHYPYTYFFKAPPVLMPHEATVDHKAGYNPLAAVQDLPAQECEQGGSVSPAVKLFGRMSLHSLSTTAGEEWKQADNNSMKGSIHSLIENKEELSDDDDEDEDNTPDDTDTPDEPVNGKRVSDLDA